MQPQQPSAPPQQPAPQPPQPGPHTRVVMGIWEALYEVDESEPAALEARLRPLFAPDVQWEQWEAPNSAQEAGVPYMRRRQGVDEALRHYRDLRQASHTHRVVVQRLLEAEDKVLAWVQMDATHKLTGKPIHDELLIDFSFNPQGRICAVRHWLDTAKHIEAALPAEECASAGLDGDHATSRPRPQ